MCLAVPCIAIALAGLTYLWCPIPTVPRARELPRYVNILFTLTHHTHRSRSNLPSEEQLTCPRCSKLYEDPKVLPCLHIMCRACIESLLTGGEGGVYCPGCLAPVPIPQSGVSNLPTAFFIAHMIESTKTLKKARDSSPVCESCDSQSAAVAYCAECGVFICQGCYDNHRVMKGLKEHKVTQVNELDVCNFPVKMVGSMCTKHTYGKLELYCCSCESLVCYECAYLEHPQHVVKPLKDCVTPCKGALCGAVASLVQEVRIRREAGGQGEVPSLPPGVADVIGEAASLVHCERELQVAMATVMDKKNRLLECDQDVVKSIRESFHHLNMFLQEKESKLLADVKMLFDNRKGSLDLVMRDTETLHAHLRTVQSFLKYLAGHSCDEELVSMKHMVCARIGQLTEMYKELQQKLVASDVMRIPSVSCTDVPSGACHLTVSMGDGAMFEARVMTSFADVSGGIGREGEGGGGGRNNTHWVGCLLSYRCWFRGAGGGGGGYSS